MSNEIREDLKEKKVMTLNPKESPMKGKKKSLKTNSSSGSDSEEEKMENLTQQMSANTINDYEEDYKIALKKYKNKETIKIDSFYHVRLQDQLKNKRYVLLDEKEENLIGFRSRFKDEGYDKKNRKDSIKQ